MTKIDIKVQQQDFNLSDEMAKLRAISKDIGAIVTFTGLCRSENDSLKALEIEHYSGMAEKQLFAICEQAQQKWPVIHISVIHRYGIINVGENIVVVNVASSHREAAFQAANFIMDFLKNDAPFWKKAHLRDNTTQWIDAKKDDLEMKKRW